MSVALTTYIGIFSLFVNLQMCMYIVYYVSAYVNVKICTYACMCGSLFIMYAYCVCESMLIWPIPLSNHKHDHSSSSDTTPSSLTPQYSHLSEGGGR